MLSDSVPLLLISIWVEKVIVSYMDKYSFLSQFCNKKSNMSQFFKLSD